MQSFAFVVGLAAVAFLWRKIQEEDDKGRRADVADGFVAQSRATVLKSYSLSASHTLLQKYVREASIAIPREVRQQPPISKLPASSSDRTGYVKQLVQWAVARYRMPMPKMKVRFSQIKVEHAGSVRRTDDGAWAIDIDASYKDDDLCLALIVAHEVAHVALGQRRIRLPIEVQNEELTDTTTVLAGFGPIYQLGSFREDVIHDVSGVRVNVARLGYLSPPALVYLSALQVEMRVGQSSSTRTTYPSGCIQLSASSPHFRENGNRPILVLLVV